jgi:hypothetical protein
MKLGTNDIGSVYLGSNAVQKVYLGTNEVWSSYAYLLDDYSGAAAAYSLRKLRSAYTGNAIRVRRAVGSPSETDIGFVNNELDVATLESFCSGTNGFVTTWYDQSGNARNATQTTAVNQPQIVSAGSIINESSKPTLQFDGVNHFLKFNGSTITGQNNLSLISVSKTTFNGTNTQFVLSVGQATTNRAAGLAYNANENMNLFIWAGVDTTSSSSYLNTRILSFAKILNTNTSLSINSTNTTTNTAASGFSIQNNTITISSNPGVPQQYLNGNCQELIIYFANQSSIQTGIETNINDFYSIY